MEINTTKAVKLISNAIDEKWKSEQKPILLSQIENLKQGAVIAFIKSLGVSLKYFVNSEMKNNYRVEHHSENKAVTGIFPKNPETSSTKNFDQFFD